MSQMLVKEPKEETLLSELLVEEPAEKFLEQIPEHIHAHIRDITRTSGLENSDESVETIARAWIEKKNVFEEQIDAMDMEEIDELASDCPDGALALTYSGSLVNIGPMKDEGRIVEYTSIGLRADVPESAEADGSILASDVKTDNSIEFDVGPVQATSPIYKIAVCKGDLDADSQEEKINSATRVLKDEFVNVNKTIVLE